MSNKLFIFMCVVLIAVISLENADAKLDKNIIGKKYFIEKPDFVQRR